MPGLCPRCITPNAGRATCVHTADPCTTLPRRVTCRTLAIIARRVEGRALSQDALSGDEVRLKPHSCGILEQHGVVARRLWPSLRRADDPGAHLQQEGVQPVDVLGAAAAEA